WLMKGYFHLWQRQYALAQSAFQRAIQIDVRVPSAYYQLAELSKEEKNWSATAGYLKVLSVLDALDDGIQMMLHIILMRQVALENGLFKPEEVEMIMPATLRATLLDKGLLPPELQRRTDRLSLPHSSPAAPVASELSLQPHQPPYKEIEERELGVHREPEKEGSEDFTPAQELLSEREEEGEEEIARVSWADAVAGEPSQAVFKVWAEPEPEEEVPTEEEKDFATDLEQETVQQFPEVWGESEPEERGLEDKEISAPEEDIFPQRKEAEAPAEDFSPPLYEEEYLPQEEDEDKDRGREEAVSTHYEPSTAHFEPPTPPPPHHPRIPIEPAYWAETPDPAVVRPQDDTPIVRLMKMKREDVQRMIERGELEESSTRSHIATSRFSIESPIDTIMGEELAPPQEKTSPPSKDKEEERALWEKGEEATPPTPAGPPLSPEASSVDLIKAPKPDISPKEAKKEGEGAKSARRGTAVKDRGESPVEEIDSGLPESESSLPLPSLPPEIQAQQEEARKRLEEVAKQVTSHKKTPSTSKPPAPSEKPKIATKTLAELYASQGDWARAIEVYEELLRRFPDNQAYRKRLQDLRNRLEGIE
ncbi:MAG: tetratricopeptide repeat protein, partial [bacterium]